MTDSLIRENNDRKQHFQLTSFRIIEDVHKDLKLLAIRENKDMATIINELIIDYIKVHKEGNPQHLITSSIENEDFIGFPAIATEYEKKKQYIIKNCMEEERMNDFGKELWTHVTQWYHLLEKL